MYIEMITIVSLILSLILNIRLAYCLGKHYTKKCDKCCQGGRKHLYKKLEEDDISLNISNNISNTNKDE